MNLTRINFCGFSVSHNQTLFSWYYGLDWLNFEIIIPKKEKRKKKKKRNYHECRYLNSQGGEVGSGFFFYLYIPTRPNWMHGPPFSILLQFLKLCFLSPPSLYLTSKKFKNFSYYTDLLTTTDTFKTCPCWTLDIFVLCWALGGKIYLLFYFIGVKNLKFNLVSLCIMNQ